MDRHCSARATTPPVPLRRPCRPAIRACRHSCPVGGDTTTITTSSPPPPPTSTPKDHDAKTKRCGRLGTPGPLARRGTWLIRLSKTPARGWTRFDSGTSAEQLRMEVSLVSWCPGRGCSVAVVPARSFAKPVLVAAVRAHTPTGTPDTLMRDHADKARRPQAPTRTRTDADKAPTPTQQETPLRHPLSSSPPRDIPPSARRSSPVVVYLFEVLGSYLLAGIFIGVVIYSPRTDAHPHRRPHGIATPSLLFTSARHLPPPRRSSLIGCQIYLLAWLFIQLSDPRPPGTIPSDLRPLSPPPRSACATSHFPPGARPLPWFIHRMCYNLFLFIRRGPTPTAPTPTRTHARTAPRHPLHFAQYLSLLLHLRPRRSATPPSARRSSPASVYLSDLGGPFI
ncbi:hypothetical protein C8R43DRAFT_617067 [Mycena crocata]|nr:hypothetical protein C8R43DRAFT_617067 [Mycena crocata]